MKRKKNRDFEEIELLKQKYMLRIDEQERAIKSTFIEFRENITGATVLNKVKGNLFGGSGLAFKLGFMAVSLMIDRLNRKRKK